MILVTGTAGFIGYHTTRALLARGDAVVGVDNLNAYYDVSLKEARLSGLASERFAFRRIDVADPGAMAAVFDEFRPSLVVHLAAQAGVRYSLINPHAYTASNVTGFLNVLEGCRRFPVKHLVYASSSSVYGSNTRQPFSERHNVDHPVSLYAASKKANELMAHTYSHVYGIPTTGLRFFTVYGPWGRPDMAIFKFTRGILGGEPIPVFNEGRMQRDFTYVDDVVQGVLKVLESIPESDEGWNSADPDPSTSHAPYRIYNIGNSEPVQLLDFIASLEKHLGRRAILEMMPMQAGDVPSTMADVSAFEAAFGPLAHTDVDDGVRRFVDWYLRFYSSRG